MKVRILIEADLNVDAWAREYGHEASAIGLTAAMKEALRDLREPEHYLTSTKWLDTVLVTKVEAHGVF